MKNDGYATQRGETLCSSWEVLATYLCGCIMLRSYSSGGGHEDGCWQLRHDLCVAARDSVCCARERRVKE